MVQRKSKKGKKKSNNFPLIFILLLCVICGAYFYYSKDNKTNNDLVNKNIKDIQDIGKSQNENVNTNKDSNRKKTDFLKENKSVDKIKGIVSEGQKTETAINNITDEALKLINNIDRTVNESNIEKEKPAEPEIDKKSGNPEINNSQDTSKDNIQIKSNTPSIIKKSKSSAITAFSGKEVMSANVKNKIALTFDAGANPKPTGVILSVLKSKGVKATFFLTGKWMRDNPGLVMQIARDGHEISNHTLSHRDLKKLSIQQINQELDGAEMELNKILGINCAPYFRAPYGSRDLRVINAAANKGYTHIYWSLDSWDSVKPGITSDEIYNRVTTKASGGDIVLMHCGSMSTADALSEIIDNFKSKGITVCTVSALLY